MYVRSSQKCFLRLSCYRVHSLFLILPLFPLTLEWVEEEPSPRKPISTFGRKKRKRRPQGLLRLIK